MLNYQADPELLRNKVILVTGASDGIGREAAWTYARHDAQLILLWACGEEIQCIDHRRDTGLVLNHGGEPIEFILTPAQQYQKSAMARIGLGGFFTNTVTGAGHQNDFIA